jgi:hypothetical protein
VLQHQSEQLFLRVAVVQIFARSEYFAPFDEGRREQSGTAADNGLQLGYGLPIDGCNYQNGGITGCLSVHFKEFGRVRKTLSR